MVQNDLVGRLPRPAPVIFLSAAWLTLGLGFVVFVMLVLEPAHGFKSVADYLDPEKIAAGSLATPWFLVDLFYLSIFAALVPIIRIADDRGLQVAGVVGGVLFFIVATLDQVASQLPLLVSDVDVQRVALIAILPIRLAVLKAAAMALAIFAWRTTRLAVVRGPGDRIWRGYGYVVLATGILFVFVFLPAPVVFFMWAAVLMVRHAQTGLLQLRHEWRD